MVYGHGDRGAATAPAPDRRYGGGRRRARARDPGRACALLRYAMAARARATDGRALALPRHPRLRARAQARPTLPRRIQPAYDDERRADARGAGRDLG